MSDDRFSVWHDGVEYIAPMDNAESCSRIARP